MPLTRDRLPGEDFNPTTTNDPSFVYRQYETLRTGCPLAYTSALGGFWTLTRHADVKKAATSSDIFISSVKAVVPSDPRGLRRPPLSFDAPHHTPFRTALDRTLLKPRLKRLEERLGMHAEAELAKLLAVGGGDICCDFGSNYVAWVEVEWLNLDAEVAPVLAETASKWVRAWRDLDSESVGKYSGVMYKMAEALVASRKAEPLDPLNDPASSLLLERDSGGEPLPDEHLIGALRQSLVVGTVAPPIILGSIVRHISEYPDIQAQLRSSPELIPAAVEEFIRLYTPYRGFARTVSEDVEMYDRLIRPGEPVTLNYASANRDPDIFENPDAFIMNRPNITSHLGFGAGHHRCAGMALARLTIQIALKTLLRDTSSIVIGGELRYAQMPELGAVLCPVTLVKA